MSHAPGPGNHARIMAFEETSVNETTTFSAGESDGGGEGPVPHYMIEVGGSTYAIPQIGVAALSWVQRPQEPTYLPTLPAWCLGLVNHRSVPVLLIDLGMLLGIAPTTASGPADAARHVFIERASETLGFLVDRTRRFRTLPTMPMPPDGDFIAGVQRTGEITLRVLNIESIWRKVLRELGAPDSQEAVA